MTGAPFIWVERRALDGLELVVRIALLGTEVSGLKELHTEVRAVRDAWRAQAERVTLAPERRPPVVAAAVRAAAAGPSVPRPSALSPRRSWRLTEDRHAPVGRSQFPGLPSSAELSFCRQRTALGGIRMQFRRFGERMRLLFIW
jgi:hypothetical protein